MKNYEKYADELRKYDAEELCSKFIKPNILKKDSCPSTNCVMCSMLLMLWMLEECSESEIDWNKVKVDTPILVRDFEDKKWIRRYFAKYEDGIVYAWEGGFTSWTAHNMTTTWEYAKLAESEEE